MPWLIVQMPSFSSIHNVTIILIKSSLSGSDLRLSSQSPSIHELKKQWSEATSQSGSTHSRGSSGKSTPVRSGADISDEAHDDDEVFGRLGDWAPQAPTEEDLKVLSSENTTCPHTAFTKLNLFSDKNISVAGGGPPPPPLTPPPARWLQAVFSRLFFKILAK